LIKTVCQDANQHALSTAKPASCHDKRDSARIPFTLTFFIVLTKRMQAAQQPGYADPGKDHANPAQHHQNYRA
jgi:hypothetical protein